MTKSILRLLPFLTVITVIVLAVVYLPVLEWLVLAWMGSPSFSHGALVTPLCLLIIWSMRRRLLGIASNPSWGGLALVALALVMRLWDLGAANQAVAALGIPLLSVGIIWMLRGPEAARAVALPGLIPLLGFPWPSTLYYAVWMRVEYTASAGGAAMLNSLMSASAVRDGATLKLPQLSQRIAIQPAALRMMLVFMTFAALYTYLAAGPPKRRWIAFAAGLPTAVAAVAGRVLMDGFVEYVLGPQSMLSFHAYSGYIAMMIAFFALVVLAGALGCGEIRLGGSFSLE